MAHDGHVLGRMVFAHAGLIFVEHDVQRPVQRVFDSPVGAYRLGNLPGIGGQTADEKAPVAADFPVDVARLLNHGDACQAAPLGPLLQPVNLAADDAPA